MIVAVIDIHIAGEGETESAARANALAALRNWLSEVERGSRALRFYELDAAKPQEAKNVN